MTAAALLATPGVHAVWPLPAHPGLTAYLAWPTVPAVSDGTIVLPAEDLPHPCATDVAVALAAPDTFTRFVLGLLRALREAVSAAPAWQRPNYGSNTLGTWLPPGYARPFAASGAWARFALRNEAVDASEALRWTLATTRAEGTALHPFILAGTLGREPSDPGLTLEAFFAALAAIAVKLEETRDARQWARQGLTSDGATLVDAAQKAFVDAQHALMNSGVELAEGTITAARADEIRAAFTAAKEAIPVAEAKRARLVAMAKALEDKRFQTHADPFAPLTSDDILRAAGLLTGDTAFELAAEVDPVVEVA